MRWLLLALVCSLAMLAAHGYKPTGLRNLEQVGEKIVGTWEVVKAGSYAPQGATYAFGKDGKLKVTFTIDDTTTCTDWTYTIAGDKLYLVGQVSARAVLENVKSDADRITVKEVLTIEKLTDSDLVTLDATGGTGIVTGFTYKSGVPIKSVYIAKPLRNGQKKFELVVGDRTFPLEARKRLDFTKEGYPNGVSDFIIQGIDESEGLVYEPGEIERSRSIRPGTPEPLGHHHRGSFPTGLTDMKESPRPPPVIMVPIFKRSPTEYRRKEPAKNNSSEPGA